MDEEYSYEIQTGRALPEFNDNYADQEVAEHESLMETEVKRPVRVGCCRVTPSSPTLVGTLSTEPSMGIISEVINLKAIFRRVEGKISM